MNGRLQAALDQLMGANRWTFDGRFGWWPVLFPGFPGPGGWHVDGVIQQQLTSPEKGLVTLFLFSDIELGDGGTPMVRGSHHAIARLLAEAEPNGLSPGDLAARLPCVEPAQIVEVTGHAGDVALLHPLLIHGFGPNRGRRIRFACNPLFRLRESMKLDRPDGSHSPVETAIRAAIGLR
jgi:ectoine hydroxylase-related dioxygenase (phytanoyl-CoA dioxygenase family)